MTADATRRTLATVRLERDSVQPLYLQLATALEQAVRDGGLKAGALLPSEAALCADLSISRITVRQALDVLIGKGLVERRQGKGTFVAHPLIRANPSGANNVYDTLFAQKHAPASKLLAFGPEVAPADVAAAFGVPADTLLVRLDRLYQLDGRAVGVALGWLPPAVAHLTEVDVAGQSTARLIETLHGLKIGRSEVAIRAAAAGRVVARHLDISERAPVLVLRRRRFLTDGRVADVSRIYMDAESYEFTVDDLLAFESRPALKLVAA
jgi:GntR family transcriptional regulator